ncbi:MAG: polysaccharide deacetylase family protein [Spirochaetales bacterium]|nr:polysaccharide deacetylase family protein [Spirochaetales bacterium]
MKRILLVLTLILASFAAFGQSLGDTNHSGGIDIVDALLIAQAYVGLNPANYYASEADVDCSGDVDIVDALLISQYYVNLISSFPCSTTPVPGTPDPTSAPTSAPTSVSGNITVRARGTMGGENLEIQVNGTAVATYSMSTSYADYSANGTGTIRVAFTNDDQLETGMDIQVDSATINGTIYQAEDQVTNTGVYMNGACGGEYSEWLHCNGYIEFYTGSSTPAPTTAPTTPPGSSECSGSNGNVYLTFDDGPTGNAQSLCNSLTSAGACKATMFVIGQNMPGNSSAYKNAGFSVQNHSQTHSHMGSWGYQQVYNDLNQCNQAIMNAGFPKPRVIRLPYLESSSTIQSACSDLGLQIISPSIDPQDWNGASTQSIINSCNNLSAGQNPLLHENQANTLAAITTIVQNLKNRNLGFTQY